MSWALVHQEMPRNDLTVEAWQHYEQKNLLFLRDSQGLNISVYSCAEDALEGNGDFALAQVCYGWYTLLCEKTGSAAHDDFLSDCDLRSGDGHGIAFTCHDNPGECEDSFHVAQVLLGNEECDGCDRCKEEGV